MFQRRLTLIMVPLAALVIAAGIAIGPATAQKAVPKTTDKTALAQNEVKQLLLLMDTDKNGKISKQEFMSFMEKEFDRLDTDKSGELDPKELTQSQLRASRAAVGK